jgi:hypothetical protein
MFTERLDVVADFVELCGYCGTACTGTVLVWYSDGARRVAFETDSGSLSVPLEQLVGAAIGRLEYDTLPSFVREWNEGRGWAELADDGAAVEAGDLLRAVDALDHQRATANLRGGEMLAGLRAFVTQATRECRKIWVALT